MGHFIAFIIDYCILLCCDLTWGSHKALKGGIKVKKINKQTKDLCPRALDLPWTKELTEMFNRTFSMWSVCSTTELWPSSNIWRHTTTLNQLIVPLRSASYVLLGTGSPQSSTKVFHIILHLSSFGQRDASDWTKYVLYTKHGFYYWPLSPRTQFLAMSLTPLGSQWQCH